LTQPGTQLEVVILDQRYPAEVVGIPYYDPENERLRS